MLWKCWRRVVSSNARGSDHGGGDNYLGAVLTALNGVSVLDMVITHARDETGI